MQIPLMQNSCAVDKFSLLLEQAQSTNQRRCLVLAGEQSWCHYCLQQIFAQFALPNTLVVSRLWVNPSHAIVTTSDHALEYLGQEFNHAVIDAHDGIDPNVLGAISGAVIGGGILILLLPGIELLPQFDDPNKATMAIWPYTTTEVGNRFLHRFANLIKASSDITLVEQLHDKLPNNRASDDEKILPTGYLQDDVCLTQDQALAYEAIQHVADGHRHRPLVLTANRGRGKSAVLGIAAARLLVIAGHQIIITGPRLTATNIVFKHVAALLPDGDNLPGKFVVGESSLIYMAADQLCRDLPSCRLLLVDEAAAIPTPMLETMLGHYSRIVFATTTYGYEGTGLGFTLRFTEKLNRLTPGWRRLEMQLPVRWAPNDPVEHFMFESLCLDAAPHWDNQPASHNDVAIEKINRDQLINDNKLLSEIFGLLILAHYQTQPRDLRYLLDGINLDIYVAKHNRYVIGAAIVAREGGVDGDTAEAIYRSERRVNGHMLAQMLEASVGIQNASRQHYWRIMRIAVHPGYRRQGIGSRLIRTIESQADQQHVDMVGSVFGASQEVLAFWHSNNFTPVQVGLKRNASHGTHSITLLKPVSQPGTSVYQKAVVKFQHEFVFHLAERLQSLESDTVVQVFCMIKNYETLSFSTREWQEIISFAKSSRQYEHVAFAVYALVTQLLLALDIRQQLDDQAIKLLIAKVLQRKSWSEVVAETKLSGKQEAVDKLRKIIATISTWQPVLEVLSLTSDE